MQFSTKIRYGIRAMIEIASGNPEKGVFQKDISINQEVSLKYLDQLIAALKAAQLITSRRGRRSGYILTKPANEIDILSIHNAFEGQLCIIDCFEMNNKCNRQSTCATRPFWGELNQKIIDHFRATTLQDLVDEHNRVIAEK